MKISNNKSFKERDNGGLNLSHFIIIIIYEFGS